MTANTNFKIGDILRYDTRLTALMEITFISPGDKFRYYGVQCTGGFGSAGHDECSRASENDLKIWENWKACRGETSQV